MHLSQADFAEIAANAGARGTTRQSQALYEKGERLPDAAYLKAIADAGADVLYILTGRDAPSVPYLTDGSAPRTPEHAALIDNYENCAPDDQAAIRRLAATAAKPIAPVKSKRRG